MTESNFIDYWNKEYQESLLIKYELKIVYSDRWFRINNLPEFLMNAPIPLATSIFLKFSS